MANSNTKHCLHKTYTRIITYICYTSLIVGWQQLNCIYSVGVMSMEFVNSDETVNLSLTPVKLGEKFVDSSSSTSSITIKSSKLKFDTSNAVDNSPITGWQYYCWNTTAGYEVKFHCIFFSRDILIELMRAEKIRQNFIVASQTFFFSAMFCWINLAIVYTVFL